jgi:hypothetical protein
MDHSNSKMAKMFTSVELSRLFSQGQLNNLFKKHGDIINPSNLLASAGDASVFNYEKNGIKYVAKIAPKNIRFFKHFGKGYKAADFKKYINRLTPYFLPVEEILYEDENIFVYTQKKCKIITSDKINKKVVLDVFRLVQFMLINNVLLTDLAPHNLGIIDKKVVIFDYHGLHRFTKDGEIKRVDWWRRLVRNLTRFVSAMSSAHKRAEYSLLMQDCNKKVIAKMELDPEIPKSFTTMVKYLSTAQNNTTIETVCTYLENCIKDINQTS